MTFDRSEYLNLAKELAGFSTTPASQEAKLRGAISRAYYAAFIVARNYLRDQQKHSVPKTGEVHRYVWEQFDMNPDPVRQSLAKKLNRLRLYRNQADYADTFPGISGIVVRAITLSEEIFAEVSKL